MHMRVESSGFSKCLHYRDHARAEEVVLESDRYHQLFDRLLGGPRQLAQKLPMVEEVNAEHLRNSEHPHCVGHFFQHLVVQGIEVRLEVEAGEPGGEVAIVQRLQDVGDQGRGTPSRLTRNISCPVPTRRTPDSMRPSASMSSRALRSSRSLLMNRRSCSPEMSSCGTCCSPMLGPF